MTRIHFTPIPTEHAHSLRTGGLDAHGLEPERSISDGSGIPCRHCLQEVAVGESYLVLSYCPFATLQPYAEVGPIFLHVSPCATYDNNEVIPAMYLDGEPRILRAYGHDDRIIYGTGRIVPPQNIEHYAKALLADDQVAYVHARSSENNCFSCRIDRLVFDE